MISNDEIDNLPEDNLEAFVLYEDILRQKAISNNETQSYYINYVRAFLEERPLTEEFMGRIIDPDTGNPPEDYLRLTRSVDSVVATARFRLSKQRKQTTSYVILSLDFKTQVRGYLTAIRSIVDKANLSEDKRDSIYQHINNLQKEVDSNRTRIQALTDL